MQRLSPKTIAKRRAEAALARQQDEGFRHEVRELVAKANRKEALDEDELRLVGVAVNRAIVQVGGAATNRQAAAEAERVKAKKSPPKVDPASLSSGPKEAEGAP